MGIEKAKSYTAYLSGGITFKLEVRENGITDLTAFWANSEPMELEDLCLHSEDIAVMGELFTLAGSEVTK